MRRSVLAGLLCLLAILAVALRALSLEVVFPGDGSTIFLSWDSYYHARRALYGLVRFPSILEFDPYLGFPDGAAVPWPPLYDFFLAAAARSAGVGERGFDAFVAWIPPFIGGLTVFPVYAAARSVGGPAAALGAAAIFAVLPASSLQSSVGNIDHQAAISLLSTTLLALALSVLSNPASARRRRALVAGLAVARSALILTWPGSIVFVLLVDGAILGTAAVEGSAGLALEESASAAASALMIVPGVADGVSPLGGSFSLLGLSWAHVLFASALSAAAGGLGLWQRARPTRGLHGLARLAVLGIALLVAIAFLRGAPAGGAWIAAFLMRQDPWSAVNLEQVPLSQFEIPGSPIPGPLLLFGFFYYVSGLAVVAVAARARDRSRRAPALLLAAWTLVLGTLAVRQMRFAVDVAPAAAIAFAVLVAEATRYLSPASLGARARSALAAAALVVLLAPALYGIHVQRARFSWRYLVSGTLAVPDRALLTHEGTLHRFAEQVRGATPETAGFLRPGERPEYGVMAFAGLGHVLHHVARRATPADNFGPYVGSESFFAADAFFSLEDETRARAEAARLRTPYVVTADLGGPDDGSILHRLHRHDGAAVGGRPRLEHFRLVTEGPAGGRAIGSLFANDLPPHNVRYKLFEIVPGALLEVASPPGSIVVAEAWIETPIRRRFGYRAEALAGDDGMARLRLPYATRTQHPARPLGPWRVTAGGRSWPVDVDDAAVRGGATIRLGGAAE